MNCTQAGNLIHAELDGDITAEQQGALQTHTASCESCSLMQAQFRSMDQGFDWLTEQSKVVPTAVPVEPVVIRGLWVRRAAGFAVAAAACLALFLAWPFGETLPEVAEITPQLQFQLNGESFDKYLAVEQESAEPNVRIVWLYKNQGYSKEASQLDRPANTLHL